jgi:hypothetical protein
MFIIFVKAGTLFKFIQVLILSAIKFLLAPPLSFKLGFTFFQTVLTTTIGGILGVIFFFYISEILLRLFRKAWPHIKNYFIKQKDIQLFPVIEVKANSKNKKMFSRKNKFIVLARRKYGLWGIAVLTPVLLSIPLGTFLANKYYKNKKSVLLHLALSVVCWSIIMSSIYAILKVKPF